MTHRSRTIIVGTDFSARAEVALEAALGVARGRPESKVILVHVVEPTLLGASPYDLTGAEGEARDQELMDAARLRLEGIARSVTGTEVETIVRRGHPAKELARAAVAERADLIVTATQGFGAVKRAILGSVTTSLLGYASCPVLVVGESRGPAGATERVLAAIDLSPVSVDVLEQAFAFAGPAGQTKVVSVFDEPISISGDHPFSLQVYSLPARIRRLEEQKAAVARLVEAVNHASVPCEVAVVPGSPPDIEILDAAQSYEPDLIVVGASGHRTWSKTLFGTNAARIIAGCDVPVLVVPDPTSRALDQKPSKAPARAQPARTEQIVYGLFEPRAVRAALEKLVDASIDADHISVVMSEDTHAETFKDEDQTDEGFVAGSAVGTAVGGVLGGLASLAASTGIGLVVVGPAVALGLIGGLIGTLVGYGVPEHDAARLHDSVERGKVLLAVHAYDNDELARAKVALADAGAQPRRLWVA